MNFNETSSEDTESKTSVMDSQEKRYKAEISKFYATIATVSKNMRKDNWTYLQRHPEIRAIIRVITTETINAKPPNILEFVANLFTVDNEKDLIEKINEQIKAVNEQMRGGTWTSADGAMNFPDSTKNSSKSSLICPPTNLNADTQEKDEFVKPVCPENFKPSCK